MHGKLPGNTNGLFYDSLYLTLAKHAGSKMVTADLKLYNVLKETSLKKHILWIEDIP